nr:hypothetical protein GCM10025732_40070 [Glycomyces mayteni]
MVSWAAVDFNGHRKPLWHALRDMYAPRLATLQPRPSERARAEAWEGLPPERDALALVLVNDTGEDYTGAFALVRESFDGTVLAEAAVEATVPARGAETVFVPAEVAAFGDPKAEAVVAVCDDGAFAPAFHYGAEVVDQRLDPRPLRVEAVAAEGHVDLRITAASLARDVCCNADTVDPLAKADRGMITLRAGETAVIRVQTPAGGDPDAFAAALRCANDLL